MTGDWDGTEWEGGLKRETLELWEREREKGREEMVVDIDDSATPEINELGLLFLFHCASSSSSTQTQTKIAIGLELLLLPMKPTHTDCVLQIISYHFVCQFPKSCISI